MEMIKLHKKGMYFTLMTIAFLIIFVFIFMIPGYKRLGEEMMVIEMRVDSMNDFIKDLERDTERGLYISSYRALLALEEYVIINGEFLDDTKSSFKEALLNGTVQGISSSLMMASTFPNWIEKIEGKASRFNIDANITVNNVSVYQDDPWNVKVSAYLIFSIKDATDIASWDREERTETSISIMDFEDPLYIVSSFGRTTNVINKTGFEGNYTYKIGGTWNVTNLLTHLENSYYAANPDAPSFLMRFENDLGSSPYGIESFVDLRKLSDYGLEIYDESSVIDYHYWDGDDNGDYRINFTPSWFKLDAGHLAKYNVTGISYPK
ncbi:hypothetical protein KY361_01735 [Candidatus Woesearchaeota archaeon]|nr:hypothetical protein [Candidatus Woesearchaeota archaeon]